VPKIQEMLRPDAEFIGCHPMAGKESSGVRNSDPAIFKTANFIITPTERNTEEAIESCYQLAEILGFTRISQLSIQEHDAMIGFLSQLTHVIAVSLMTCNESEDLVKYTGDSFRDLTRIAKINEKMWSELFLLNKKELLSQIDRFSKELIEFRDMLAQENREGMEEKMKLSTKRRHQFD
jgi:prephenate dehydrogenase